MTADWLVLFVGIVVVFGLALFASSESSQLSFRWRKP